MRHTDTDRGAGSRDRGPAAVRADQQSGPYRRVAQGDGTVPPAAEGGGATDAGAGASGVLLQQPVQDGPSRCNRRLDTGRAYGAGQVSAVDDDLCGGYRRAAGAEQIRQDAPGCQPRDAVRLDHVPANRVRSRGGPVDDQDAQARTGEKHCGGRARAATPYYYNVEVVHAWRLRFARPPARSRVRVF